MNFDNGYYYGDDDDDDETFSCYETFNSYEYLISVSNYIDNPKLDKITNIMNAMVKTAMLKCKEVCFRIDFVYGNVNDWIDAAKKFNETYDNSDNCNYSILVDEEAIVTQYVY